MNYFGSNGALLGIAAERGNLYPNLGNRETTAKWPAFYIKGDVASIGDPNEEEAKRSAAAFSAGPLLIDNGRIVDIAREIRNGGYDSYSITQKREQRAVGITTDGLTASGEWDSASIQESAENMLSAGCIRALKVDSGGSMGRAERRNGKPVLSTGYSSRKLPSVLIFTKVERIWEPEKEPLVIPVKVNLDIAFDAMKLTPNFTMREFVCHCGCGQVSVGPGLVNLVTTLQILRGRVKTGIVVTSGYRCAKWDKIQGSSTDPGMGPHTTGTAADIWWKGATVNQMAEAARSAGFSGVGRYSKGEFIHVDLRQPASYFIGKE